MKKVIVVEFYDDRKPLTYNLSGLVSKVDGWLHFSGTDGEGRDFEASLDASAIQSYIVVYVK